MVRVPVAALLACAVATGCQTEGDAPELSQTSEAVKGDMVMPDAEFSGVCGIEVLRPLDDQDEERDPPTLWCSCTLVAEDILLTAAHCIEENTRDDLKCADMSDGPCLDDIDIRFGNSFSAGTSLGFDEIRLHRYYDPDVPNVNDIAMIHLSDSPGAQFEPVTLNEQDLAGLAGETITFVGYGVTGETQEDFGSRRRVDSTVVSVAERHIIAGSESNSACFGDNGGPLFYDFGGGAVQIAFTALLGEGSCNENARRLRVDVYTDDFIYPFIDSYVGACALDGGCVSDGCRSPDPDCDPCLQDGVCCDSTVDGNACAEGGTEGLTECPTRDFDCELGVFPGGRCEGDPQCEEGGRCLAARDDSEYFYCNQPCDPSKDDAEVCPATMECTDLGGGEGECEFTIPSPGSQGDECDCGAGATSCENTLCNSGICEEGICANVCAADADCPAPPPGAGLDSYTCSPSRAVDGTSVCTGEIISGGGGFCDPNSIGGRGRAGSLGGLIVLLLAALALVFTRRRG